MSLAHSISIYHHPPGSYLEPVAVHLEPEEELPAEAEAPVGRADGCPPDGQVLGDQEAGHFDVAVGHGHLHGGVAVAELVAGREDERHVALGVATVSWVLQTDLGRKL